MLVFINVVVMLTESIWQMVWAVKLVPYRVRVIIGSVVGVFAGMVRGKAWVTTGVHTTIKV